MPAPLPPEIIDELVAYLNSLAEYSGASRVYIKLTPWRPRGTHWTMPGSLKFCAWRTGKGEKTRVRLVIEGEDPVPDARKVGSTPFAYTLILADPIYELTWERDTPAFRLQFGPTHARGHILIIFDPPRPRV